MRVLVIEDHDDVCELVGRSLAKDGHRITTANTLAAADECIRSSEFDAAVLDLGMPDGDGLDWCKRLRESGHSFPVLVLTAQSAVATRVSGLDAGADDFVAKPFAVAELRARIRALGRRGPVQKRSEYTNGNIHLDFSARRAHVDGREVPLTSREWSIVDLLVSREGRVVSRADILEMVGGEATPAAEASLEVLIGRIRKKLGATFVRTVRGEGYAAG